MKNINMKKTNILALTAGLIIGIVFTALKLPLPAPATLPGVVVTIGVFLGGEIIKAILSFRDKLKVQDDSTKKSTDDLTIHAV